MKTLGNSVRFSFVSLAIWLAMGFLNAVAQVEPPPDPNALSDVVGVVLQKSTNYTVAVGSITELDEINGTPLILPVPGVTINAFEPGSNTLLSDQWIVEPYQVYLVSDSNPGGLPPRAGAIIVPDEDFFPVSMRFTSDADVGGQLSDTLEIFINSVLFTNIVLFEGTTESAGFFIPGLQFDLYELGQISDYVDISPIHGQILSDLELGGGNPNGPPGFQRWDFEESATGPTTIDYDILVSSDVIPEPNAMLLVAIGSLSLLALRRRR